MMQILRESDSERRYSLIIERGLPCCASDAIRSKKPFCHVLPLPCRYRVFSTRTFTLTRGALAKRSSASET